MSKLTNTLSKASKKVTRSVPVYATKNLVEGAVIKTRNKVSEVQDSRDNYFQQKDEAKAQRRAEKAALKEQERMEKFFAEQAQAARDAHADAIEADFTEATATAEV